MRRSTPKTQRVTGQFLKVQGPASALVSIAGWTLDPLACTGMTVGAPRVDLAALVELDRLLIDAGKPAQSRSDIAIVREGGNEASQIAGSGPRPSQMNLLFETKRQEELSSLEREKVTLALAQILMQAALAIFDPIWSAVWPFVGSASPQTK